MHNGEEVWHLTIDEDQDTDTQIILLLYVVTSRKNVKTPTISELGYKVLIRYYKTL